MDQTSPATSSSAPGAAPTPSVAPSNKKMAKPVLILLIVVFVAVLAALGYFLAKNTPVQKSPSAGQTAASIPVGYTKAEKLVADGGSVVSRSSVQIIYSGTLVTIVPGKSWTLDRGGKQATVTQEGSSNNINYYHSTGQNSVGQVIDASLIKIGDAVSIVVDVDKDSGSVSVRAISVLVKPAEATPSASPKAQ